MRGWAWIVVVVCVCVCHASTSDHGVPRVPEFSQEDVQHLMGASTRFLEAHRKFISDMKGNAFGADVFRLAQRAPPQRHSDQRQDLEHDIEAELEELDRTAATRLRAHVGPNGDVLAIAAARDGARQANIDELRVGVARDAATSFLQRSSTSELDSEASTLVQQWWRKPKPAANTNVRYDKSQGFWRCRCKPPRWDCKLLMSCLAPEITEEDKLKELAFREKVAKETGVMPQSQYEGMRFHANALDCTMRKRYDCTWQRDCECMMPWRNVKQCRPLRRVTPKRCPVKCQKKAWPWNWLCTRYCGCPLCSSPYCAWHFFFTLICRRYCVCEAKCPDSPISLEG